MALYWFFLFLLILAPLPFGMVHDLTQALLSCLVLALLAGECLFRISKGQAPGVSLGRIWPETIGFALVLGWVVAQISAFTPTGWHHPLWAEAGEALARELEGSISLARGAGFRILLRWLAYGAAFWLALQWGRNRHLARQIILAIALASTGYALYGLAIHLGGYNMVLWVDKTAYINDLTGTFINRNSFATYLGMGLVCAVGLYLTVFFRALDSRRFGRDKILHLLQQAFVKGSPLLACILILLSALFLTHSRAGVTCTIAALILLILMMGLVSRLSGRLYRITAGMLLAGLLGAFILSGEGWLERLIATEVQQEQRFEVYGTIWDAIKQAPWTGYGAGGFERVFPMFAQERASHWEKAHSDWLETVFGLGIPGAAIWFAVLVSLAVRCLTGFFRRRRDHIYPLIGFCLCILLGLHSLVDFSLQIPAVALTFSVLLGVGVGQSWSSVERAG